MERWRLVEGGGFQSSSEVLFSTDSPLTTSSRGTSHSVKNGLRSSGRRERAPPPSPKYGWRHTAGEGREGTSLPCLWIKKRQ